MKQLFYLLLLLTSASAMAQSPWTQSREEVIPAPAPTTGVQQIALQIVVDETSEWAKPGELKAQVQKASGIFRQCDVELGKVEVKYVKYSQATIDSLNKPNPYKGPSELILAGGDLSATRPAAFLFGKQIPSAAKAFNQSSVNRLRTGTINPDPLLHLCVLSGQYRVNDPVPGAGPSYNNFAHELAHILGDIDHVDEMNNLMSNLTGKDAKTGHLNPQQCDRIRQYSLTHFSGLKSKSEDCP